MTTDPGMILVEEALERVLADIRPLTPKRVPLADANGLVLADDVRSAISIPPLPNSAMDGYAVRAEDVAAAAQDSPVVLPVIGEIAAGSPPEPAVTAGAAVRIMTGAPVPPGADAIGRRDSRWTRLRSTLLRESAPPSVPPVRTCRPVRWCWRRVRN